MMRSEQKTDDKKWNKGQAAVLDSLKEDGNVLVSAAAGSGKTAVLVERIIRSILEEGCNIDEILVVTFTRAAAQQMKTKILSELEKRLETADREQAGRIMKQLAGANKASITTIDSFCNTLVRENFNAAGIDPAYTIYDPEEARLLREEIMDECFEEWYREREDFRTLSYFFMKKNIDDSALRKHITKIYETAQSFADDSAFYKMAADDADYQGEVEELPWIKVHMETVKAAILAAEEEFARLRDSLRKGYDYDEQQLAKIEYMEKLLNSDIENNRTMRGVESYKLLSEIKTKGYGRFDKKGCKSCLDEAFVESVAKMRDAIKKSIPDMYDLDAVKDELDINRGIVLKLISYAEEYSDRLMQEKKLSHRYEFADISHFAYKVLFDKETGRITPLAERLRDDFKYIYIDEYQDSNDMQESILNAIARKRTGSDGEQYSSNIFMVGDVKQSIYRFRLARPKLFMDKSEVYHDHPDIGRLFNLNVNYRSRREVLEAVNFIFERLMKKSVAEIDYTPEVRLNTPEDVCLFPPSEDETVNCGGRAELMLLTKDEAEEADGEDSSDLSNYETEAIMIADKILEIVYGNEEKGIKPFSILNEAFDKNRPEGPDNPRYRRARFGDITILQSTIKGTNAMLDIYDMKGIPVSLEDKNGYFDASEILTMVSVLQVIDNARQDIAYASVLLSEIGGLTETELALIKTRQRIKRMYLADVCSDFTASFLDFEEDSKDAQMLRKTAEKLSRIDGLIRRWKKLKGLVSIAELIDIILQDTGYDIFVSAMPRGDKRLANLRMLRYRAENFERAGYTGIFDFLRYIEKCRIHDIDFGESSEFADAGNVVHVTSMHASKGLEYPIVIAALLGHKINMNDLKNVVMVNSDYGIAMDQLTLGRSGVVIRKEGLKRKVIRTIAANECLAEQMRLLYVAMTRAKEKLIMCGKTSAKLETLSYSYACIVKASSLLDFVLPALNEEGFSEYFTTEFYTDKDLRVSLESCDKKYAQSTKKALALMKQKLGEIVEEKKREVSENPYDYSYPYEASTTYASKTSVTAIERSYIEAAEPESSEAMPENSESQEYEPIKSSEDEDEAPKLQHDPKVAMRKGTVVHKVMELLDFENINSQADMKKNVEEILKKNFFTDEDRKNFNIRPVLNFYSDDSSSLFRRMKKAAAEGLLFREKSFFMGLGPKDIPSRIRPEGEFGDDMVTVQGTMDAFFYERDEKGTLSVTLVDYKTDRVRKPEELTEKYSVQLYLYAFSLSRITDAKINGIIFYSFGLNREVDCSKAVEDITRKMEAGE